MIASPLQRRARIIEIAEGQARLRVESPAACGGCRRRDACGGGQEIVISAPHEARPGAQVTLAIPEAGLVQGALFAYLLPAAAMLGGAASLASGGDLAAAVGAACGLGLGLIALRCMRRRLAHALPLDVTFPDGDDQ